MASMGYGYSKGEYLISAEKIEGFGKNPGLWIGKGNQMVKLASFGNEKKAEAFLQWLEYFMWGPFDDPDDNDMVLP